MVYIIMVLIGFVGGTACTILALDAWRRKLLDQRDQQDARIDEIHLAHKNLRSHQEQLNDYSATLRATGSQLDQDKSRLQADREQFDKRVISYEELLKEN